MSEDRIAEVERILWGGPGREGMVHVTQRTAQGLADVKKILLGNGDTGVVADVRRHNRLESGAVRIAWLLVAQIVTALGVLGWLVVQAVT